jgi:hypothetical protein
LFELKANGKEGYINEQSLLEKISPQNKYNAALAYARLIAFENTKATEDEIRFTALVEFNA